MLISADDSTLTRPLYVMSVDDASKTVKVKFPGADSGSYFVSIESTQIGRIDGTYLALDVRGQVTGFEPKSGSRYGGTLVTIDGVNFSDDPYDNPVKVGDYYCLVLETGASQIKCRIMETFE